MSAVSVRHDSKTDEVAAKGGSLGEDEVSEGRVVRGRRWVLKPWVRDTGSCMLVWTVASRDMPEICQQRNQPSDPSSCSIGGRNPSEVERVEWLFIGFVAVSLSGDVGGRKVVGSRRRSTMTANCGLPGGCSLSLKSPPKFVEVLGSHQHATRCCQQSIPTTDPFKYVFLTVGTGLAALNPKRGGEYYEFDSLPLLRDKMLAGDEGRAIIKRSTWRHYLIFLRGHSVAPTSLGSNGVA